MKKLFAKFALAAGVMIGAAGLASAAAAAPGGSYFFNNTSGASSQTLQANSFGSGYVTSFPSTIGAGSSASGSANQTTAPGSFIGTVIYTNSFGDGCSFTVYVGYSSTTGLYNFSFTASKYGNASAPGTCSITASRNTSTGTFVAYPVFNGFN